MTFATTVTILHVLSGQTPFRLDNYSTDMHVFVCIFMLCVCQPLIVQIDVHAGIPDRCYTKSNYSSVFGSVSVYLSFNYFY